VAGSLADRVALVTGGAGTIGRATAHRFAQEGARVALADLRLADVEPLAAEIKGLGLELDVRSDASWGAAIAATISRFGQLDVLVNNAGIADSAGVEDVDLQVWSEVLAVNQTGVLLGMRHAAPEMRRAGGGAIVNISSIHGLVAKLSGDGSAVAYTASKGAVRMMSKAAAMDLGADGIRVNSVHPGYVDEPMEGAKPGGREHAVTRTPFGKLVSADDVAAGILFLSANDSTMITGTELTIDGGYTAN
jgi:NAD(P)-dependent dehydrogenase (short-subunit alcohol dehydrogenase family)